MVVQLLFIWTEMSADYSIVHVEKEGEGERELMLHNYGHLIPNIVSNSKHNHQIHDRKDRRGHDRKFHDVTTALQVITTTFLKYYQYQLLSRYLDKWVPCYRVHIYQTQHQTSRIGSSLPVRLCLWEYREAEHDLRTGALWMHGALWMLSLV